MPDREPLEPARTTAADRTGAGRATATATACSKAALTAAYLAVDEDDQVVVLGSSVRNIQCSGNWATAVTTPSRDGADPALVVFSRASGQWVVRAAGTGDLCSQFGTDFVRRFPEHC